MQIYKDYFTEYDHITKINVKSEQEIIDEKIAEEKRLKKEEEEKENLARLATPKKVDKMATPKVDRLARLATPKKIEAKPAPLLKKAVVPAKKVVVPVPVKRAVVPVKKVAAPAKVAPPKGGAPIIKAAPAEANPMPGVGKKKGKKGGRAHDDLINADERQLEQALKEMQQLEEVKKASESEMITTLLKEIRPTRDAPIELIDSCAAVVEDQQITEQILPKNVDKAQKSISKLTLDMYKADPTIFDKYSDPKQLLEQMLLQ